MEIQDIIQRYHDLLTDEVAEEANAMLRRKLRENSLYFGDRPLCIVLRPHFYREADWAFMRDGLTGLLSAFARAHDICMNDANYRSRLHLDEYEEKLLPLDHGAPVPWSSSRLDTFYVVEERSLMCVEYNAETPAGIGYNDLLANVFDELAPMKQFSKQYNINAIRSLDSLQAAVLKAYHDWGGREKPQIAILDWQDVPTLNEHEITREYFERHGFKSILADPRSLDYRDGQLVYEDFRIDLIYKRVLYSELVSVMGFDNAVIRAMQDRAVYMTNAPSAKLMAKKASLAFMSDERNSHLFSPAQQASVEAHIPWTRVVEERKTMYKGQEIDLIPYIAENQDEFVLKPNDEYGGAGVVLGWQSSGDGWASKLNRALESPHVVQEKVPLVKRDFPTWDNGDLIISERFVDADPYAFNGDDVDGCLTRLSPLALLNVTAGGGSVVPTYIIK